MILPTVRLWALMASATVAVTAQVSVPLQRNAEYKPNPRIALQQAQTRYSSFVAHKDHTPQSKSKEVYKIPMSDYMYDIEYYGTVDVGTPPQSLRLDFDTGSADLWFASTHCKTCGSQQIKFDATKSTTFKPINRTFEITYGDKSKSSGTVGTDVVRFGDLTIENQVVELATEESKDFQSGTIDGLVGLAFGPLASVKGIKTPLENLIDQGVLAERIFGVFLGKGFEGGGGGNTNSV